jgi:hypothetical protein
MADKGGLLGPQAELTKDIPMRCSGPHPLTFCRWQMLPNIEMVKAASWVSAVSMDNTTHWG